jgi:thiosulfate dehydrogenase [quinone] large subunit
MSTTTQTERDAQAATGRTRADRWLIAGLRIGVALLWIENSGWKKPPDFTSLRKFTTFAVEYPVFPPFTWVIETIVLPNFTFFGWMTLLLEASIGAFLLIGLATRLWALVGLGQTMAITFSVLNAPHEWEWAYYLMMLAHVALFATAAGRSFGLDGVLRPALTGSSSRPVRMLGWLS